MNCPHAQLVPDKRTTENACDGAEDMDLGVGEADDYPFCIECDGRDDATIWCWDGHAVCTKEVTSFSKINHWISSRLVRIRQTKFER
jgi:hypothetical protein